VRVERLMLGFRDTVNVENISASFNSHIKSENHRPFSLRVYDFSPQF